jgi:hypothetical protein
MTADLCRLVLLFLLCLIGLIYAWHHHQQPQSRTAAVTVRGQRLRPEGTRPRTPDDCPACSQRITANATTAPVGAPVRAWCELKSRSGAAKRIPTDGFACPTPRCAVLMDRRCAPPCPPRRRQACEDRTQRDLALPSPVVLRSAPAASPLTVTPLYRLKTA